MDRALIAVLLLLAGCSQKPVERPKPDPTKEPWYRNAVEELESLYRQAEASWKTNPDHASSLILRAQPIITQVIGVPKPTLEAMQFASDVDDLYGRMLMKNRHYGSARLLFQKNVARWTHWRPRTEDTDRRRKVAEDAIAECDRLIEKQR